MNREDIIRMAREAGILEPIELLESNQWRQDTIRELERFAALVAAAERNKLAAWMMRQGYATGHGDSIEKLLEELEWQIREKLEKGVSDERRSQPISETKIVCR